MTLNQIISRIRSIALAHLQLRNFYFGNIADFLTEKTTRYASMFLQDAGGSIELSGKTSIVSFQMFLLDLVHVSQSTKENELDVQSDMLEVAKDILAVMNISAYYDWKVSSSNPLTILREGGDDLYAGVMVEISVSTIYEQDVCAAPTSELPVTPNSEDMKVYDTIYVADGAEGSTLNATGDSAHIPFVAGKKILLITREQTPIYKTSSAPNTTEYVWNNISLTLGTQTNPGERFLFLWRNY